MRPLESNTTECYVMPCSFNQRRLWLLAQLMPHSSAYNVLAPLRIRGRLDVDALSDTLNEIVRRHEVLRTTFGEEDGEPVQIIWPEMRLDISLIDLSGIVEADRDLTIESVMTELGSKPFDLKSGPLCHAHIFTLDEDDHALLWNMHHIVSDGWSYTILMLEIESIYPALCQGLPSPIPELRIQYADYAIWQREHMVRERIESEVQHWHEKLAGAPASIELPTDYARTPGMTSKGHIQSIWLPEELVHGLKTLSRDEGATMFITTFAAFFILLWRYSNQNDIVVGTAVANRERTELENLIGFFVNMLPIRAFIDSASSFTSFLTQIRLSCADAFNHQELPLDKLVEDLRLPRDLTRSPLFQVMFLCHEAFIQPPNIEGLKMSHIHIDRNGAPYDITLFMIERDNRIRCSIEYDVALYNQDTISRMLENYGTLLQEIVMRPETRLGDLKAIAASEMSLIRERWNDTNCDYGKDDTIISLIRKQTQKSPKKVAVRYGDNSLTYEQLDYRATQLAKGLASSGVKVGDLVGIFIGRSHEMVVGLLGIMKCGAAYVPMDPAFPLERLRYMLEDAAPAAIVTQKSLISQLPPHGDAAIVFLDDLVPVAKESLQLPTVSPTDLAYVIYTSGSTGRPKGVQISHRSVVNFLNSMKREPGLAAEDICLSVTTISFDIAGLEIYLPLTVGATVEVASNEVATDGYLLRQRLEQSEATMLQATPITWRMLLESGWEGNPLLKGLIGGETVPRDLANLLEARCASAWNMYGPTETTIWSTVARIESGQGAVSIGRPIDNTRVYVVSPEMQLQPIGVVGELLIGGDGLALGYLKLPDLTSEKFVADPFSGVAGAKIYRTGDLARWRADGTLECLGRIDHQVKIRGFRIELLEIESVLEGHAGVRQAIVVAQEVEPGDRRLVAYVIPEDGYSPTIIELREYMRKILPEYMLPAALVTLKAFPMSPNGKIDRKGLPAAFASITSPAGHVAPRDLTETKLLGIFSEILSNPNIGVTDGFFENGGHSLLAVRLVSRIEMEFGVRLPLITMFNNPNIEQLANVLRLQEDAQTNWNCLVPMLPNITKPRIYLIHGAGGNLLLYRELAEELSDHFSIYGFQSQGLDGKSKLLHCIEDMAALYARELRKFQPMGPYLLAGYCMGGAVAYEMARFLRKDDGEIGMVALLDTYNLSAVRSVKSAGRKFNALRQKIGFHFDNLGKLNARELIGYLSEKLRMAEEAGLGKLAMRIGSLKNSIIGGENETSAETFIQEINHQAAWDYVPGHYEGRITLFKPIKNYDFFPDPKMGWGNLVKGELDIIELSTNPHGMLLRPFVKDLAEALISRYSPH